MPDIFNDPPERLADAAVTLPSFAMAIRAVDSRRDAKTMKQAVLAAREGKAKATYQQLLVAQSAEWHEAMFMQLAADAVSADAEAARKQGGRNG